MLMTFACNNMWTFCKVTFRGSKVRQSSRSHIFQCWFFMQSGKKLDFSWFQLFSGAVWLKEFLDISLCSATEQGAWCSRVPLNLLKAEWVKIQTDAALKKNDIKMLHITTFCFSKWTLTKLLVAKPMLSSACPVSSFVPSKSRYPETANK